MAYGGYGIYAGIWHIWEYMAVYRSIWHMCDIWEYMAYIAYMGVY